jgi:flagellar hook protein FlgE
MMRSMFSAISGLKNHQTFMDVVANNIANVNTTAFKQQRVTFSDILSQTVRAATGPNAGKGGVNAEQIGLGVGLAGIDTIETQGTLQSTGKLTDMAISGDGYFEMSDGKQNFFSRDGSFDLGTDGTLLSPSSGLQVMGWGVTPAVPASAGPPPVPAAAAFVNTATPVGNINIPIGAGMTGSISSNIAVTGNLNSNVVQATPFIPPTILVPAGVQPTYAPVGLSTTAFDSLGNAIPMTISATPTFNPTTYTPAAAGPPAVPAITTAGTQTGWSVVADTAPPAVAPAPLPVPFVVTFDGAGKIVTGGSSTVSIALTNGALTPQTVALDLSALTQLASPSNMIATADGAAAGTLTSFTVGQNGDITGVYSNGVKQALGQIALASFSNPAGLSKAGGNLMQASGNSGAPNLGVPGANGRGQISTGFLEGSNVDLAQQFTNMIMAERGFQANSKVITTSDEILQDLVNLKR